MWSFEKKSSAVNMSVTMSAVNKAIEKMKNFSSIWKCWNFAWFHIFPKEDNVLASSVRMSFILSIIYNNNFCQSDFPRIFKINKIFDILGLTFSLKKYFIYKYKIKIIYIFDCFLVWCFCNSNFRLFNNNCNLQSNLFVNLWSKYSFLF